MTTSAQYKFYVVAKNKVGVSQPSTIVSIYAAVVPTAPTNVKRVAGSNTQTTIDLEWTRAYNGGSTITGYQVWWNQGGDGPVTDVKVVLNTDTTTVRITQLTPG